MTARITLSIGALTLCSLPLVRAQANAPRAMQFAVKMNW